MKLFLFAAALISLLQTASAYWDVVEEERLFQFAGSLFDEGEYQAALAEYKRLIFLYPTGDRADDARYRIGACYQNMGMYRNAIAAYEAYLTKYPSSPLKERARLNIAECYLLSRRGEEAKRRFEMLISSPDDEVAIRARFLLGLMGVEGENWLEAARWFRSIMELYPKSDQALLAGQMYDLAQRGATLKKRSTVKAALLSALLPGVGQIYGGDLNRGLKILTAFGLSVIGGVHYARENRSVLAVHIGLLSGAIYLWNIRDATQVAKTSNLLSRSLLIKRMRAQIEKAGAFKR
jgi:TolA-binding protein